MTLKPISKPLITLLCLITCLPVSLAAGSSQDSATVIEFSEEGESDISRQDVEELLIDLKRSESFSVESTYVEGRTLHFKSPRLKARAIDPYTSICLESKRNFFGRDVCQLHGFLSIGDILCESLGLVVPDSENDQTQGIRSSSSEHIGVYRYDGDEFSYMRTASMLVGRTSFNVLNTVSCVLPE